MSRYQKGKIYQIVSENTDDVYIGSTCVTLSQRLSKHRRNYKSYLKGNYNFVTSFKVLQAGDYKIYLIEEYPCESKIQLLKRERYWIENKDCCNKLIPSRTKKEADKANREARREYHKKWRTDNEAYKEKCKLNARKRRQDPKVKAREAELAKNNEKANEEIHCECGSTYKHKKRARHLKTKIHLKFLETGVKHVKKTKEQWNEKVECECGSTYIRRNYKGHEKSKTHQNYACL